MKKSNLSAILLISSFLLMPPEGYGKSGWSNQNGYSWIDSDEPGGPLFDYRDISSTGNLVAGLEDDNHVGPLRIGFSFPFYENEYVEFYIQSNGLIGFDDEYIDLANQPIPLPDGYDNIIAWMWDDMYPHSGTSVYYETIGDDLIVQFVNYGECCSSEGRLDAQVILSKPPVPIDPDSTSCPSSITTLSSASGHSLTISARVRAETVVRPGTSTAAETLVRMERSRSEADNVSRSPSASISRFDSNGWAGLEATASSTGSIPRQSSLRSTVSFISESTKAYLSSQRIKRERGPSMIHFSPPMRVL